MVEPLDPEDLQERMRNGEGMQIVDIRPEPLFRGGHLQGAVNLPLNDLPTMIDEIEWNEDVVVVCPIGESSRQAARLIESYEGISNDQRVFNLTGGYREWDGDLTVIDDDEKASREGHQGLSDLEGSDVSI